MVARAAYAQLRFSPVLLAVTVLGMFFLYLLPPISVVGGLVALTVRGNANPELWLTGAGLTAWALMAGAYLPMLRWYGMLAALAPSLPVTAALYTAMTVDSALSWWRGQGGAWKGRSYNRPERGD